MAPPAVDWRQPWLAPLRCDGAAVAAAVDGGLSVAEALNAAITTGIALAAGPLRFVPQAALPRGEAFETYIARTSAVPTRDHLHDLFSGLVWLHFPALKRRLHELQADAIARDGIRPVRGPLRDALTRFDEHGALLEAPPALWQALRTRDWQRLFVGERALWRLARLRIVGHALLEQLATAPRKPLTAFVWAGAAGGAAEGAEAAEWAVAEAWTAAALLPLPVLGVPGWWPANEDPGFYADPAVFRAAKSPPAPGAGHGAGLNARTTP